MCSLLASVTNKHSMLRAFVRVVFNFFCLRFDFRAYWKSLCHATYNLPSILLRFERFFCLWKECCKSKNHKKEKSTPLKPLHLNFVEQPCLPGIITPNPNPKGLFGKPSSKELAVVATWCLTSSMHLRKRWMFCQKMHHWPVSSGHFGMYSRDKIGWEK